MKKVLSLSLFVLAIFSFVLLASLANAETAKGKPLKIGVIYTLSGVGAPYARPAVSGHELAAEEINNAGGVLGRPVKLVVRDDKGSPEVALREARDLVFRDEVDFLMGAISSAVGLAISSFAKEQKILFINSIAQTAALTEEKGHRYVFRTATNTVVYGRSGAMMAAQLPHMKYYVIGHDYEYGHRSVEDFWGALQKLKPGVQRLGEQWPKLPTKDFTPFITAILAAQPEAVFSALWGADAIGFIKQARGFGYFEKIKQHMGPDQGDLEIAMGLGEEMPDGILAGAHYPVYAFDTKEAKDYIKKYQDKTGAGEFPPAGFGFGYYATYFLSKAIEKAGATDKEKVIDALEGFSLDTVVGKVTIRAYDHQAMRPFYWGYTKKVPEYPFAILRDVKTFSPEETVRSLEDVKKLRGEK